MVAHITTHVDDALERFITQYKGKPRLSALLSAWVKQVQSAEDVCYQLATLLLLDSAVGDQLDKLGLLVGEERQGRGDELFRVYVKARIRANRSLGTANDILAVMIAIGAVPDDPPFLEYLAAFTLFLASLESTNGETLDPNAVVAIVRRAKPVGVQFVVVAPPPGTLADSTFAFSHVEESDPARGFGHAGSTAYGGVLSAVYV